MLCEAQIVRGSSLLQVVPISIVQISEGEPLFDCPHGDPWDHFSLS